MIDLIKKRSLMLCLVAVALIGLSSCDDDDPNYDNVILPEVELPPHTLTGMISGKDGTLIVGATVKMGNITTTTNEQGVYIFNDVQPGEYVMQAESEGRLPITGKVVVNDVQKSQTLIWNAVLFKDIQKMVTPSQTEEQRFSLEMEVGKDNPNANIPIEVIIPANALNSSQKATITFKPLYNKSQVETRATSSEMLIGTQIDCDAPNVKFDKPITLQYTMSESLAKVAQTKKYVDGRWIPVESSKEGGVVMLKADEPAPYGVFINVQIGFKDEVEPIKFTQSVWDNLYGSKPIHVKNVGYSFKMGTEITTEGNSLEAAIIFELMKSFFGSGNALTIQAVYPLNVTVEVGTRLEIIGVQEVKVMEIVSKNAIIRIKNYGLVHIHHQFSNREHSGGTN